MKSAISRYVEQKLSTEPLPQSEAKRRYTVLLDKPTQDRIAQLCQTLKVKDTDLLEDLLRGATEEAVRVLARTQKSG